MEKHDNLKDFVKEEYLVIGEAANNIFNTIYYLSRNHQGKYVERYLDLIEAGNSPEKAFEMIQTYTVDSQDITGF